MKSLTATFALVLLTGAAVQGDTLPRRSSQSFDAVKAGELVVEPPTLICLGFEWEIAGDQNRNATVAVAYRRAAGRGTGRTRGRRRCRCCGWAANRSSARRTPFRIDSPGASWTSIRIPSTRCGSP